MSKDSEIQNTSRVEGTEPPDGSCEVFGDSTNTESNDHHPSPGVSKDEDKVPADYVLKDIGDIDDDTEDRGEGINQPVSALEAINNQDASGEDTTVAAQSPTLEAPKQAKREIPEDAKRIALDLHTKGKTPKQIAAHYSVADYGLTEGDVADLIQEQQKGRFHTSDYLNLFNNGLFF
jgi:hypothetical protein